MKYVILKKNLKINQWIKKIQNGNLGLIERKPDMYWIWNYYNKNFEARDIDNNFLLENNCSEYDLKNEINPDDVLVIMRGLL